MRFGDVLICETGKDGGPNSRVDGFWLVHIKSLFSIALLRFNEGSREAYHSHAFDCISWVLSGGIEEHMKAGEVLTHRAGLKPIITRRDTFHKVYGLRKANWILTFRGPWASTWQEVDETGDLVTLTHNRVEVERRVA